MLKDEMNKKNINLKFLTKPKKNNPKNEDKI
jgi:hypothetical protein